MRIKDGYADVVEIYQGEMDNMKMTFRPKSLKDLQEIIELIKRLSNGKVWFTVKIKLGIGEE